MRIMSDQAVKKEDIIMLEERFESFKKAVIKSHWALAIGCVVVSVVVSALSVGFLY